jgi:D-serine deaminase-like pyridoxal phosphate-dependent protein
MDNQNFEKFTAKISRPTLLVNRERVLNNIKRMTEKAKESKVIFRPHFKTHQSSVIGNWFREFNVDKITVSSLDMATYFSNSGWKDITVAIPVNIREINRINELSKKIKLNLLVESEEVVGFLSQNLLKLTEIWIKIDTGYNRTGLYWDNSKGIRDVTKIINASKNLKLKGILTHTGHSYQKKSTSEIKDLYKITIERLKFVKEVQNSYGYSDINISIGDTPCCSVVDHFSGIDEIRPGNFVFYDVMQLQIGSCCEQDIALALVCPIIAKQTKRNEFVVHGGAIHFSKEFISDDIGNRIFGLVCNRGKNSWGNILPDTKLISVSQEHGIIRTKKEIFNRYNVGELLFILPVHSCLTVDLMREMITLQGEIIKTSEKFCY